MFLVVMVLTLQSSNYARETEVVKSNITTERTRLLILPAKIDSSEAYLLNEVTNAVVNVATNLGRFEVFDQHSLDKNLLQEYTVQGKVLSPLVKKFGQASGASDLLIVSILNFSQVDIPEPEEEQENNESCVSSCLGALVTSFFELLFTGATGSDNVETQLSVLIRKIDVATGEVTESVPLTADHTGGSWESSKKKTMTKLTKKIVAALKNMYPLSSKVTAVRKDDVQLILGSDITVKKGTIFEIVNPAGVKIINNKQVTIPEHRAGFVSASGDPGDSKNTKILRQWLPFKPEYRALEYTRRNHAIQIKAVTPFSADYWRVGIQYHADFIKTFDWGGGLQFIRVNDSFDDSHNGFSFGGFGHCRFINNPGIDFGLKLGLDIDIIFGDDDATNDVSLALLSLPVGLCTELMLSAKSDLVIDAGYRIGGKKSDWTYSSEGNSHPAIWNDGPPEVDISGLYLSVGMRFLLF